MAGRAREWFHVLFNLRQTSFNELLIEQSEPEHVQEWVENHLKKSSKTSFEDFLVNHKNVVPATKSLIDKLVTGCWWDENDMSAHVRDGILYIHCHFWKNMEEIDHLFYGPCATQLGELPALSYTEIKTLHQNLLSSGCEFAREVDAEWFTEIITVLCDDDDGDDDMIEFIDTML